MLEVRELPKPPKDIAESTQKEAERVKRFLKSRLKSLKPERAESIEVQFDKFYESWKKQTKPQRARLVRYENLLSGVVEDSNFPFEGASNITLHYAAGMARTFRASFNKTAYQDEDLFYPIIPPQSGDAKAPMSEADRNNLAAGFNHSFSRLCNGLKTLKEGTVPCVRDGTLIISGRWRREVERCFDQRSYANLEAFKKDYPDQESTGLGDEEYARLVDAFLADDEPEVLVVFSYDFVKKDEPEYRVGPWAKFVRYPVYVNDLSDCELHGYIRKMSPEELKLKLKRSEIYERGAGKVLAARSGQKANDQWDKAVGFIEGLVPDENPEDRAVYYIDGVALLDLDNDGVPEKYEIWYAPEEKALLKLLPYRLRKNVDAHVPFRMIKRENSIDGVSLIGDCEDLFNQIDVLTRHRNNVRILTTSPVFLFNSKYKEQLDLGRSENVIRPGLTLWVDDPKTAGQQLAIQDMSTTNDNLDEQNLYMRHVELVFGPSQGMSGQQTPGDARAPGNKTIALLNQANARIDDYLDEFMLSGPKLADLHAALLFQYKAGPVLEFEDGGEAKSFPLEWLGVNGLRWGVKRRSVQLTPEFGLARLAQLEQTYGLLLPRLQAGDPVAVELWNRTVLQSGEPQADKLLMDDKKLMALQQAAAMQAQSDPKNPENQVKTAGRKAFATEIAKHGAQKLTGALQNTNGQKPIGAGVPGQKK